MGRGDDDERDWLGMGKIYGWKFYKSLHTW